MMNRVFNVLLIINNLHTKHVLQILILVPQILETKAIIGYKE